MSGENIPVTGSASNRQKVATVDVSEDFETVTFSFVNGPDGAPLPPIEFTMSAFPSGIHKRLAVHGVVQKMRDSYAGVKGNAAEARSNALDVFNNLMNEVWRTKGDGEGVGGQGAMYIEAIARIQNRSIEDTRARIAQMSEEWKKAAQNDPQVKQVVAQIRLERAQAAANAAAAAASTGQPALDLSDLDRVAA